MKRFDLVTQLDIWGCGIACVASLLAVPYAKAYWYLRDEKGESIDGGNPGLEPHHIALVLQKHGVKVVADWQDTKRFSDGTIVCVEGPGPYDGSHYILQTPLGWMDPWVNMRNPNEPRRADYISAYPKGTRFSFALVLVPKSG